MGMGRLSATLSTFLLLCSFMPTHMHGKGEATSVKDTLVMNRVFAYGRMMGDSLHGQSSEVYFKYDLRTQRRNFSLFFVPSMYYVAKGRRRHLGEIIGHVNFNEKGDYLMRRHATLTTVRHGNHGMSVLLPYLTPDIYGATLFGNALLSPFHPSNRAYYRYRVARLGQGKCRVAFRPRVKNTQLVAGYALVAVATGRVESIHITGEYDMLRFAVDAAMGGDGRSNDPLPIACRSEASFHFLGNSIKTRVTARYDNAPHPLLNDSSATKGTRALLDSIRPLPLTEEERAVYAEVFRDGQAADTAHSRKSRLDEVSEKAWDFIGDNLLGSIGVEGRNASVKMSPLLNPLYLSYSERRGLAYKVRLGAHWDLDGQRSLSLQPTIGYNFKISQFYFSTPLRFTYGKRKANYVELTWANGNRITNSSVLETLKDERRDTVDFDALNLDYFKDMTWKLSWNVGLAPRTSLTVGSVYHRRHAVNAAAMSQAGKPTHYRSFAPFVKLSLCPIPLGPTLTLNYERSLRRRLNVSKNFSSCILATRAGDASL